MLSDVNKSAGNYTTEVNFIELNKRLQKSMNVQKNIRDLIFKHDDDKFYYD